MSSDKESLADRENTTLITHCQQTLICYKSARPRRNSLKLFQRTVQRLERSPLPSLHQQGSGAEN
jgi:hypothetical protein